MSKTEKKKQERLEQNLVNTKNRQNENKNVGSLKRINKFGKL